jgi:hypothetical protein
MSEIVLTQWTIYEHPRDYPRHWVAREWHVLRGHLEPVPGEVRLADSLLTARQVIPAGLTMIGRNPDDDSSIVETWT